MPDIKTAFVGNLKKWDKRTLVFGLAVGISAVFANIWAFWGIHENFHEGWYYENLGQNLMLMFRQYLLVPLSISFLAVVSIRWNKVGALLHLLLAAGSYLFFGSTSAGLFLVALPLAGLALLYWFGRNEKRKIPYLLVLALPLLQIIGFGIYHSIRVSQRFHDGNFAARQITGNDVNLIWAPEGPGWPDHGTSWQDAKNICAHLDSSGLRITTEELNIWRLPTVEEAVRSMVYHGKNAGGIWDSVNHKASYQYQPDKESPLWNMYRKTIYWWTSTEVDESTAYIIVYNGSVWPRNKNLRVAYLNFRAVRSVNEEK